MKTRAELTPSLTGASFQRPHYHPSKFSFSSIHTLLILTRCVMAHEGGEQKSERNIKTQSSHLDLLQVTIVQVVCISDTWYL
jgi:hypothetical protein